MVIPVVYLYLKSKAISFKPFVFALFFISISSGSSYICFFEYTHIRFLEQKNNKYKLTGIT